MTREENTNYVAYLIELSQQGRKNAFFDLCEIDQKNIFSLVYCILGDYELAQQITLDVYFHVWDSIKSFSLNRSFLQWVKDLAIRHAIFELNRRGLNSFHKKVEKTAISEIHQLDRLIISLPDEERIIMVLHDMEGLKYSEVKNYLNNLSVDEIQTKLINAREYLVENL